MAKLVDKSNFLKYTDISDSQDTVLTIAGAEQVTFDKRGGGGKEVKWVLSFEELDQKLALNKVNRQAVIKATGVDDSDELPGKKIALYVKDDIEYEGDIVSGIRVRPKVVK